PTVGRYASSHRRCGPAPGVGQTRMRRAEVINRPDKIHAMLQCQGVTRQRTPSACQRGQPLTKRGVQPLDVRGIDHALPLRPASEGLDACRHPIDNPAFGLDYPPSLVALDDLGDQNIAPPTQPGPSALPCVYGLAKGLPYGPEVCTQTTGTDKQGAGGCAPFPPPDQPPDQGHVTLLADLAGQPQACLD